MSCFIMNAETIGTLAASLEKVLNMGFNFFGFEAPGSLFNALRDCENPRGFFDEKKIYAALYELNSRAYCARYKEESADDLPKVDFNRCNIVKRAEYNNHLIVAKWHYQLLKILDCFIYQVSEDVTRSHALTLALKDMRLVLMAFIIHNNDIYANLPWGTL